MLVDRSTGIFFLASSTHKLPIGSASLNYYLITRANMSWHLTQEISNHVIRDTSFPRSSSRASSLGKEVSDTLRAPTHAFPADAGSSVHAVSLPLPVRHQVGSSCHLVPIVVQSTLARASLSHPYFGSLTQGGDARRRAVISRVYCQATLLESLLDCRFEGSRCSQRCAITCTCVLGSRAS